MGQFSKDGHRAGLNVVTTFKARALLKAAQVDEVDEDDIEDDHKGRKTVTVDGWFQQVELTAAERFTLRTARDLAATVQLETQAKEELEARLKNVADYTEALKAQIFRSQIAKSDGGAAILEMLDTSLAATIEGKYLALL